MKEVKDPRIKQLLVLLDDYKLNSGEDAKPWDKEDAYRNLQRAIELLEEELMPIEKVPEEIISIAHSSYLEEVEYETNEPTVPVDKKLYTKLQYLGIIPDGSGVRSYNKGCSNYSEHIIQPWSIILDWGLDYWDGDIIKRVLRTKKGESKELDYQKIIHICEEKLRQIELKDENTTD